MLKEFSLVVLASVPAACGSDGPSGPVGTFDLVAQSAELVGGTGTLHVFVTSKGGFSGAIDVALVDPPAGLTADPLTLPPHALGGDLVLHAPAGLILDQTISVTGTSGTFTSSSSGWVSSGFDTGSLDPTFGDNGIAIVPTFAGCGGLALQPDGKIVVGLFGGGTHAGQVARLTENGGLDPTFGTNGVVDFPGNNGGPSHVYVEPDGSILAVGQQVHVSSLDTRVWKIGADGKLDASFGSGGYAIPIPASSYVLSAMGGVNYLVGTLNGGPGFVARLRDDGTLDPSIGDAGVLRLSYVGAAAALPDGSGWLMASATGKQDDGSLRGYLGFLSVDGSERPQLAASDAMTQYDSPLATAEALYVVLTEVGSPTTRPRQHIQRLRADLTSDPTFSAAVDQSQSVRLVDVQPDGQLVVLKSPGENQDHIVRYRADGSLDPAVHISLGTLGAGRLPDHAFMECAPVLDAEGGLILGYGASTNPPTSLRILRVRFY